MRQSVLILIGLATMASSAFATKYQCVEGRDKIQITRDDSGRLTFSDGSTLATASDFNCQPKGQGGSLYVGGSGPNSWGYRVPAFSPTAKTFTVEFVWDEDSDGYGCEYKSIACSSN